MGENTVALPVKIPALIGCRFYPNVAGFPAFVTASEQTDLFVAGDCQQGYNRAVRAFPRIGCGVPARPRHEVESRCTWVDSAEVAYDAD